MEAIWKPSPNHSGNQGPKTGVVVHHWDKKEKRPSLLGTVGWLCNPASRVSAHYVVSAMTIYQLVDENMTAWHSLQANPFTIGIEVDPNIPGATYDTLIELVRDICARHRLSPATIQPHRFYVNTECPGDIDIDRIRRGVAEGDQEDMTNEQFVRAAAQGLQFSDTYPQGALDNWVSYLNNGGDRAAMLRTFAVDSLQFHSDTEILEIFQEIRERNGYHYPGGAKQFAQDRTNGGSTAAQVLEGDIAYYMAKEQQANQKSTPVTDQDIQDLSLGRSFRTIIKEAK